MATYPDVRPDEYERVDQTPRAKPGFRGDTRQRMNDGFEPIVGQSGPAEQVGTVTIAAGSAERVDEPTVWPPRRIIESANHTDIADHRCALCRVTAEQPETLVFMPCCGERRHPIKDVSSSATRSQN